MGHYYSEMTEPSPIYTTIKFEDNKSLKKGMKIIKQQGYWRKGGRCYLVTYHEMKGDDRKWFEIHCEKDGDYFISVSVKEWYFFKDV